MSTHRIRTNDGVELHVEDVGEGAPLVLLPGWSGTIEMFRANIDALSSRYRCITVEHRGHGRSDKPDFGYRPARVACDVRDVLDTLDVSDVALLGHSMGAAVILLYWDMFGPHRLGRLVLVDQPTCMVVRPGFSEEDVANYGAILTPTEPYDVAAGLTGKDALARTREFVTDMARELSPERTDWLIQESLQLPRSHAAELCLNTMLLDLRDIPRRIPLPTLCVAGRNSHVPWTAARWIQEQMPDAQVEVLPGSHCMFLEHPNAFNEAVLTFLATKSG